MSCCMKEGKPNVKESCCESKQGEKAAKAADESKSGCGCEGSKESAAKKEEKKEASCC